jgi:branched-subunit amino acid transport protein
MIWTAVIATSFIAFMLKYLGQAVPAAWLENARIQKFALYLPTALLAALVAVQSLGSEKNIVFDARSIGVLVAGVALFFKAPFPVVVLLAALTSAGIHQL